MVARRRGAPSKDSRVSKDEILRKATQIVSEDGADRLSIRGLAASVGLSAMAVYNHFPSKDDLLREVVDELLTAIPPIPSGDGWIESARQYARNLRKIALENPEWIRLLSPLMPTPSGLARSEATLRVLQGEGLTGEQSVTVYTAMYGFAIGHANLDAARVSVSKSDRFWAVTFADVSPELYPTLAALSGSLDSASATGEFERALDRILMALEIEMRSDRVDTSKEA